MEKAFAFDKIGFKVLKTFKIFSDCHIKLCRSRKRKLVLKTPGMIF